MAQGRCCSFISFLIPSRNLLIREWLLGWVVCLCLFELSYHVYSQPWSSGSRLAMGAFRMIIGFLLDNYGERTLKLQYM